MCPRCRRDFGAAYNCEVCGLSRGVYTRCSTCGTNAAKEWVHDPSCYWHDLFPPDALLLRRFGLLAIRSIRQRLRDRDKERIQESVDNVRRQEPVKVAVPYKKPYQRRKPIDRAI
jgi:hypothetical protein